MKWKRIYIEITNHCNLSCSFCSKSSRPKKEMSIDEFREVVKKVTPYTNTIYLHIKGEPLLHSKLDTLLTICDEANLKVNITTNGTLLKQKLSILQNHPCLNHLNLSLHSENEKENYLTDIFTSVDKLSPKVVIIYRFWTLNDNQMDLKTLNIVKKMKEYYNLSTEIVNKIKTEKNIKIRSNLYVDKANLFKWPTESESHLEKGYCLGGKTHIGILSDGTVVPCCLDGEGDISLGNIFEESLDQIRAKDRYQKLLKGFQDRSPSETLCKKCTYKERFLDEVTIK